MATVTITITDEPQDDLPAPPEDHEQATIKVDYDPDPIEQGWSHDDAPPIYLMAMEMVELWSRMKGATTTYEKTMDSRDGTTHETMLRKNREEEQ